MRTVNSKIGRNSYIFPPSRDTELSLPAKDRMLHASPNVNLAAE